MIVTVAWGIGILAIALLAVWASRRFVQHPEDASGTGAEPADTTSDRFYRGADRPAGPDAEDPPAP